MPSGHVQRKHPRVNLRRLRALVPEQALQRLQRRAGIKHVHGVAVPEAVQRDRYRERHAVGGRRLNGLVQPGARGAIGDFPQPHPLRPPRLFAPALNGYAQGGDHHFQLRHELRIGKRHQAVRHAASGPASGAVLGLLPALLERGQLDERVLLAQQKVPPLQRQRLAEGRAGVPQRGEQHFAPQVGHEVEQGADLRRQQVLRQVVNKRDHLAQR